MPDNPLKLKRVHHIEFWVGNAKQASFYYRNALGFSQTAYTGLETGNRKLSGYVLEQGRARFLLTTPLTPDSPVAEHIRQHGDGVHDVAFEVDDADAAFVAAVARGAKPAIEPHDWEDDLGVVRHAAIHTYGETLHSFISRNGYSGPFLPGYKRAEIKAEGKGILRIDHVVGNVGLGEMNLWADWYSNVLGFKRFISFDDKDISTDYSALMSIVMADESESIKFPINEPAPGRKKSQIDEFLEWYGGPGVQHIALQTRDILSSVTALARDGVEFLRVPDAYYELLPARVGKIDQSMHEIQKLGVLVDRDQDGYLLQIFSKPVEDRPTLFFEIIDRHGCRGFGKGNFRALFEAIEREQAVRGNL